MNDISKTLLRDEAIPIKEKIEWLSNKLAGSSAVMQVLFVTDFSPIVTDPEVSR